MESLVGMRVTVALGSRTPRRIQDLRGNDEGAARRIQDLRGNDEEAAQERRVMQRSPYEGAGDRERWLLETLVGMRVTVALGSRTPRRIQDLRGNDEGAARRIQDLRGNDEGAARERRVM